METNYDSAAPVKCLGFGEISVKGQYACKGKLLKHALINTVAVSPEGVSLLAKAFKILTFTVNKKKGINISTYIPV